MIYRQSYFGISKSRTFDTAHIALIGANYQEVTALYQKLFGQYELEVRVASIPK